MTGTVFENPRRAIDRWALAVLGVVIAAVVCTLLLDRHAGTLRDESAWICIKRAEEFRGQKNEAGALTELKEASLRDPTWALPHEQAGLIRYNRKEWEEAVSAYRKALECGSTSEDTRGKIIWCLIHLENFEGAAVFGEAAMKNGFDTPNFRRYVAEAYWRAGKPAKALPHLEGAVKSFPKDLFLLERLVKAYRQTGDQAKAEAAHARIEQIKEQ